MSQILVRGRNTSTTPTPVGSAAVKWGLGLLLSMSFLSTIISGLYGIALPNILIFSRNFPILIMGLQGFVYALGYASGPFIVQRFKLQNSLKSPMMAATLASLVIIGISLFEISPYLFLGLGYLDGFFMGVFWLSVEKSVTRWQQIIGKKSTARFFRYYGLSWNFGILIGAFIGVVLVGIGLHDYQILWLCFFLAGGQFMLGLSLVIPREPARFENGNSKQPMQNKHILKSREKGVSLVTIGLLGILLFQTTQNLFDLLIPYLLLDYGTATSWIYLSRFSYQALLICSLQWITRIPQTKARRSFEMVLIILGSLFFLIIINPLVIGVALSIGMGFALGIIYAYSGQVLLEHSTQNPRSRVLAYSQLMNALGFGFFPVIASWFAEVDLLLNFKLLGGLYLLFAGLIQLQRIRTGLRGTLDPMITFYVPKHTPHSGGFTQAIHRTNITRFRLLSRFQKMRSIVSLTYFWHAAVIFRRSRSSPASIYIADRSVLASP
jgi:MFS family permease